MKKVNKTFLIMLIIGIVLFAIGMNGYQDSFKEVSTGWKNDYSQKELEEQQKDNRTVSIIAVVGGVALVIGAFIYNSHIKTSSKLVKEIALQKNNNFKEQLSNLKSLYDDKAITKEEYEKKKKEILDKM